MQHSTGLGPAAAVGSVLFACLVACAAYCRAVLAKWALFGRVRPGVVALTERRVVASPRLHVNA